MAGGQRTQSGKGCLKNGKRTAHTIRQRVCELASRQRTQSGKVCENWKADSAHNQAKGVINGKWTAHTIRQRVWRMASGQRTQSGKGCVIDGKQATYTMYHIRKPLHSITVNKHTYIGLARKVYIYRIWPYNWWFPRRNAVIPHIYIYMVLANPTHISYIYTICHMVRDRRLLIANSAI